jgi:hypothetical protein
MREPRSRTGTQTTHVKIKATSMNTTTSYWRRRLRQPWVSGSVMISSWRISTRLVSYDHSHMLPEALDKHPADGHAATSSARES